MDESFGTRRLARGLLDLDQGVLEDDDGTAIRLTPLELKFLRYLDQHEGEVVAAETLHAEVWGHASRVVSRAVDNTASRLRKKIEQDPRNPVYLRRIPSEGFVFSAGLTATPAELPPLVDPFFGREAEQAALRAAMAPGAVVTVTGPGGIGKTRLVREVLQDEPQVLWIELAPLDDGARLAGTVAAALGVPESRLSETLAALDGHTIVLDNAEQLTDAVAAALPQWRGRQRWVVTSRQVLKLAGERVLRLGPLSDVAATALLLSRAGHRRAGWGQRDRDAATIADLVAVLERWPLALELAAGQAGLLTPQAVAARLRAGHAVAAKLSGRPERHASLARALEGSWALLPAAHQEALCALTVFGGGFSLDATLAVLGEEGLEALEALIDHSLVYARDDDGDTPRFDIRQAVRDFAAGRAQPEPLQRARAAAWAHFAAAYGGEPNLQRMVDQSPDSEEFRLQLRLDFEDVCAAARGLMVSGDPEAGAWLARTALEWLTHCHRNARVVTLAESMLSCCPPDTSQRPGLRLLYAQALTNEQRPEGLALLQEIAAEGDGSYWEYTANQMLLNQQTGSWDMALIRSVTERTRDSLERYTDDPARRKEGHYRIDVALGAAEVRFREVEPEGRARMEGVLAHAREKKDVFLETFSQMTLGIAAETRGDFAESLRLSRAVLRRLEAQGIVWTGPAFQEILSLLLLGRLDEAQEAADALVAHCAERVPGALSTARVLQAHALWDRGEADAAAAALFAAQEALALSRKPDEARIQWHLERARQATGAVRQEHHAAALALLPKEGLILERFARRLRWLEDGGEVLAFPQSRRS